MDNLILSYIEDSSNIHNICTSLFHNTPVKFLHYTRVYSDGTFVTWGSRGDWMEHYFEQKYYEISSFRTANLSDDIKFLLTQNLSRSKKIICDAREGYNIGDGIVLIKSHKDFTEFYLFCPDVQDTSFYQFFLNNVQLLEQFTYYFLEKIQPLLLAKKDKRLVLPYKHSQKNNESNPINNNTQLQFSTKRFYIDKSTYLTSTEIECLHWLSLGKSASEIALIFNKSYKTVENQIDSARKKLNCYKTTMLISRAKELRLI